MDNKTNYTIKDWPENERPRERLIKHGAEKLQDAELLAILLRTGDRGATAIDLARELMHHFGSFRELDSRSLTEICKINGIGEAKAAQIKAALEIGKRLASEEAKTMPRLMCAEDVFKLVSPYLRDNKREEFKIVLLTSRNNLIIEKTLFEGSLTESLVSVREVVKEALNYSAASVIFVHNHPSGDPTPSSEDKRITKRLVDACKLVDINPFDHIIIGKESFFSFAEHGLM